MSQNWPPWEPGARQQAIDADRQKRREQSHNPRRFVEGCSTCEGIKAHPSQFGPSHDASYGCQSGWYTHCTCDTCF